MPRLTQLGKGDVKAVIEYLESETDRIVEMRKQHPIQDHDHSNHVQHVQDETGHDHGSTAPRTTIRRTSVTRTGTTTRRHDHGDGGHDHAAGDRG